MELILTNLAERELIRMRQAAQSDWITMRNSERRAGMEEGRNEAKIEIARGFKREGIDPSVIARNTGLSLEEIARL